MLPAVLHSSWCCMEIECVLAYGNCQLIVFFVFLFPTFVFCHVCSSSLCIVSFLYYQDQNRFELLEIFCFCRELISIDTP